MAAGFIFDGPEDAGATLLLAHGAGAPMDSRSMDAIATALAGAGLRVARFEFGYMAARRAGRRKPPPRADMLKGEYLAAVDALRARGPLVIGGKSMGGRVASMVADGLFAESRIAGLLCIGYPFHPIGKPTEVRTAHLASLRAPTLIAQGTRDQFGTRDEVASYDLSDRIEVCWFEDGDHDLKPRKSVSGLSAKDHLDALAQKVRHWSNGLSR